MSPRKKIRSDAFVKPCEGCGERRLGVAAVTAFTKVKRRGVVIGLEIRRKRGYGKGKPEWPHLCMDCFVSAIRRVLDQRLAAS